MSKNSFWTNLEKQGIKRAKKLAEETSKELEEEAIKQTIGFYNEYEPIYYKRHINAGTNDSGLAKSIEPIVRSENHGRGYCGGIRISTSHMYTDYSGTPFEVLSSYLDGFHGLPTFGNYLRDISSTNKFKQLENYKNMIIKRFK